MRQGQGGEIFQSLRCGAEREKHLRKRKTSLTHAAATRRPRCPHWRPTAVKSLGIRQGDSETLSDQDKPRPLSREVRALMTQELCPKHESDPASLYPGSHEGLLFPRPARALALD